MKKRNLLLMLLLAIGLPWVANAQQTANVVSGGTGTNQYVPMYNYYNDYGHRSEWIIPASYFEDAGINNGDELNSMTIYRSATGSWTAKDLAIILTNTTTSYYENTNFLGKNGTTVFTQASYPGGTNSSYTFSFDAPFEYTGGSLVVHIYAANGGTCSSSSSASTWLGYSSTTNYQALYSSGSSSAYATTGTRQYFLPNTTFTYEPASTTATAPGVTTNNTPTNLTNTSVTLGGTITDMGGANSVQAGICYGTTTTPTTSDNHAHSRHTSAEAYTQDITGLLPNTTYYYRAYAYNSANSLEDPTYGDIYSFTTACNITLDQPANGAISASVAGGAATTSSTYALPGQSVTLTATAVSGYSFDSWNVIGVTGTANGNTYTFTMPSNDVTATASIVPTSGGSSSEFYYELATSIESGAKYLVVNGNGTTASASSTFYAMEWNNTTSTSGVLDYGTPTFKDSEKHKITDITPHASGRSLSDFVWTITASGSDYTLSAENGGSTYYLIETSADDGNLHSYAASNSSYNADQTKWTFYKSSNEYFLIHNSYWYSQYSTPGGRYYYLYYSSGFKNYWSGTTPADQSGSSYQMYLYKETSTTTYAIVATANPTEGGTVSGSDYYANGASCTLTATPAFGYDFVSWTENGTVVSTDAEYTFTVSSARTLVANFESQGSCIKPTDVAQVANTEAAHQAQLSWTENNEATQWEVVFSTDSEFDPDAATPITVNDNPTVTIPSLAQETTYYVYVRAICGENSQSGWSNKATFTTISGRQAPTVSYDESTLTDNSVTITWTGVATNVNHQSYDLYYSTDPVMPQTPVQSSFIGNINAESKELTDLTSQTTYYVWVRDNCGTDGYSDWSEVFSFRTACGIISDFPWNEDFEDFAADIVPDCWDNSASTSSTLSSYPERIWGVYSSSNNKSLRMYNFYVQSGTALINSPSISVPSEGTYELTFKHSNRANCGALSVKISEDGGATFVEKGSYDATGSTSYTDPGTFTKASIPLTDYAGKTIIVQFFANANFANGAIFIDDVKVKETVVVIANQIVNTVSDHATQMTWNEFVNHWNNGDHFTSTTFTLMDDITVSTMVGTRDNLFTGTFDGNGHTITVDLTATEDYTAPFRFIRNATIQNLKVDGTINDDGHKFCAGFAGDCYGNNTFTNCVSDVTINATTNGDGTHGGFIARNYGSTSSSNLVTTTFNGCAFTGKLLGASTNQSAGFCGWSEYYSPNYSRTVFNNCVFDPSEVTMSTTSAATFARTRNATYMTISNCYFMEDFNDGTNNIGQGKQAYTITGVGNVSVAMAGTATTYSVSGITAYSDNSGMLYNGTIYAGENDIVNLTLSGSTTGGYQASEGVLERDGDNYNILMDANDTEISVDPCPQVTGLTVSNITATNAKVSWDKMATQATGDIIYQVVWAEAGEEPDWNSEHALFVADRYNNENAPYCTASDYLDPETEYVFYVRRKISQSEYCDAVATDPFTTLSNCSAPAELNASNITDNSATLSWSGAQESYNVRYRKASSSEILSEGFEGGSMPAGWTKTGTYWQITSGTGNSSYTGSATGSYNAGCYIDSYSGSDILVTPAMDLSTVVSATLDFNFWNTSWSGDINTLNVYYRVDEGAWNLLYTNDSETNSWEAVPTITLEGLAANYQIGFECETHYSYGMGIDDVVVIGMSGNAWNESNTGVTSPLPISGLEMNTTYEWQVQGINSSCGENDVTDWSEMATFNTPYPTFTKTIEAVGNDNWANGKGGYYFIASPVAEPVTPTANNGFIVGDYDLYNFSQATDGEGNEWINFKDETLGGYNLTNGKGYLYASKEGTTLTFTGTPGTDGNVPLDNYDGNARFKGWNLIGNPFAQDAYIDKTFYTLENGDTYTSNTPETAIHAMQGVLIIAEEDETSVTFTTEAPATNDGKLNMNLRRDNKQLDNAILVFGGEQQLGKISFREGSSKVYMPVEGKDYAITSVEGQVGEVPVSFKAENNGTYSLNFTSEEVSFSYLHLIDNMTGNDVNLLANPTYSFDARTSDYESRFRLVFATGSSVDGDSFGFVNESGNFCIFGIEGEATVQVIDILGHVLSSETFSGSYEKRINGAPGVYMVRLIQGNDVKVQKVVVR